MNNQFYHTNLNGCGQCYSSYRTYTSNCCNNVNTQTNCCSQNRPVQPCCPNNSDDCNPATITIGSTTTLPAGSNATVTNSGTAENVVLNFGIPRGTPGATGPVGPRGATGATGPAGADGIDGEAATITVGTTTTSAPGTDAVVTNSGTESAAVLNFIIPRGETGATGPQGPTGAAGPAGADGADGIAATITVGTTTTGEAGTDAVVTNSGTESAAVLNFIIPRGETGATGPVGATGPQGPIGETGPAGADGIDGEAATITVGTTTTGEPGTTASVTNVGTESAAILNFVIPRGEDATITPGAAVTPLEATATLDDVIATVNALITSLTNAGFLA